MNYHKALKRRHEGTGMWLLQNERYNTWMMSGRSFLWLHGIPGCGKTILSSIVLEDVLGFCGVDSDKAVCYFYFDFSDEAKRSPGNMVRSLITQLADQCLKPLQSLEALVTPGAQLSYDGLLEILRDLCDSLPRTYVVLDALDECNERNELIEILENMARWNSEHLHVLVTSRRERDIETALSDFVDQRDMISLQTDVVDEDIRRYVSQRLADDKALRKWRADDVIREEIEVALMEGARGMCVLISSG